VVNWFFASPEGALLHKCFRTFASPAGEADQTKSGRMRGISLRRFFHYFIGFVFLLILIFPHPLLRGGLSLWRGERTVQRLCIERCGQAAGAFIKGAACEASRGFF